MITKKQLKIFEVFAKKPFGEFTRKQIKKEAKERSNNALALAINLLKKEEVIIEKKIGNSGLLMLNLNNDLTYIYLSLCNYERIPPIVKQSLKRIKEEIDNIIQFYSLVIFGSYAIYQQKSNSDLDIAIFINNEEKKPIIASINSAKLKTHLDMDIHIITKAEMIEMLTNDEENLGKQIARKHLSVYNIQIFYELIKEGMKHGFRI